MTNSPPAIANSVPADLLSLFQAYTQATSGRILDPYQHQADVFAAVMADQEAFVVAGTAAGKTLAIAIPLFAKLQAGHIRKVLLMYPTIALMEDQGKVMQELAAIVGTETAKIQGGMSRSKLVAALNKRVILATPDAIFWFFRRNVKYSGVLMYALALVDEIVLDEAHLFSGLMLRNFEHLWQRIRSLAALLERSPRLHILTATPTADLRRLNNGAEITGKSRCQDVRVEMQACGPFDRSDAMVSAVEQAIAAGRRKMLVVCNSARVAHLLFEKCSTNADAELSAMDRYRFGRIMPDDLLCWMKRASVDTEILDGITERLSQQGEVTLSDLPGGLDVLLPLGDLVAGVTEVLERQCWLVKRALWGRKQQPGETWESLLHNRPLPCTIVAMLRSRLQNGLDPERQQALVDEWLADTLDALGAASIESVVCRAPDYAELKRVLATVMANDLIPLVLRRLVREVKVSPEQSNGSSCLHRYPICPRWLESMVDKAHTGQIRALVLEGLESDVLKVNCRHIRPWKETSVPTIIYSGSMAKHSRAGLIDVFSDLERAVLISTSAVEVGVDFAADTLITEECEGNSFLQRFGRVGRHENESQVLALVSGETAARWHSLEGQRIDRLDFSTRIVDTFPRHSYAVASPLVDAGHYLVNEQLGRVGTRLNQVPSLAAVRSLAEQLRAAEIPVGFGLRSTLPQITIRDGVGKDPFYLLRYVDDQHLRPADSPFEVAQARLWFTELLYRRAQFSVTIDQEATLLSSRAWFRMSRGEWRISQQPSVGATYARGWKTYYEEKGGWAPWLPGNCVLLHGDVYLQRADRDMDYPTPEPICDDERNPLFIPSQNYLVLLGWDDPDRVRALIAELPISNWEELYYDWDGVALRRPLVILERTAGACFAAYREWLAYADQRLQT